MPARVGARARRSGKRPLARFRRVGPDEVREAALAVVRAARGRLTSQGALWRAVRERLRLEEPAAGLTPARLRRLLLGTPGVRVDIEFAERPDLPAPSVCPVCAGPLRPILNRSLDRGPVVLGQRCPACSYWTHRRRRSPVRYTYRAAGTRPTPPAASPRERPRPPGPSEASAPSAS